MHGAVLASNAPDFSPNSTYLHWCNKYQICCYNESMHGAVLASNAPASSVLINMHCISGG